MQRSLGSEYGIHPTVCPTQVAFAWVGSCAANHEPRHRDAYSLAPPPTGSTSPVIQPESSDARKTATFAMSSTAPTRPNGVRATIVSLKLPSEVPAARVPSVSTSPGASEFTRIFRGPSSSASLRVITSTAPLVALYSDPVGIGVNAATELRLMIDPLLFIDFRAACVLNTVPSTLRSNIRR